METLAWTSAMGGLLLGGLASFVPGFPGCAVALLGLVAFAGLTDFQIVTGPALVVAAGITVAGAFGQVTGPVLAGRAAGGSAGVATGAALGAAIGALVPVPGAAWACAISGALSLGLALSRREWLAWVRGVLGTAGGCLVGWAADLVAVLAIGAVLGLADFLHVTRAGAGV